MTRVPLIAVLLAAASLARAAAPAPGAAPVPDESLAHAIAIAEAPGDLRSDALVLRLLQVARDALPDVPASAGAPVEAASRAALRARADVALARLEARLDAEREEDPWLLAIEPCIAWAGQHDVQCAARAARLEALAGDNAYFHLLLAGKAWREERDADFLRHLQAAASAPRYEEGMGNWFGSLHRRMRAAPPGPAWAGTSADEATATGAMAIVAARLPSAHGLLAPCRAATDAGEPAVRQACHAIATRLADQAGTLLELGVASALVESLGTSREQARIAVRHRQARWWAAQVARHAWDAPPGPGREARLRAYWADLAAYGELGAMQAMVVRLGLPDVPPADFEPLLSDRVSP